MKTQISKADFILFCSDQDETEATPYLLDLLHDRNTEVQKVCDATLQMIGEISPDWSQKLMSEKFRFHNAQWLEMVQSQTLEDLNSAAYYQDDDDDDDGLLHDSDILDIDKAELMLGHDLDMFSSSEETPEETLMADSMSRSRPLSAYRRVDKQFVNTTIFDIQIENLLYCSWL